MVPYRRPDYVLTSLSFVLSILMLFSTAAAHASNRSARIPIFFVSDRRPPNIKVPDHSPDQVTNGQCISWGTIWVAQECPAKSFAEKEAIKRLQWKLHDDADFNCGSVKVQFSEQKSMFMNFEANSLSPFKTKEFQDEFLDGFKRYIRDSDNQQFILFLHGCCCSLEDSFRYAAELAASTRMPLIMFDWASPGIMHAPPLPELNSYRRSERSLEISAHNFHELMSVLSAKFDSKQCIGVAHSMGNRLLCSELLRSGYQSSSVFDQMHLVAADLSLPSFLLDQDDICRSAGKVYVYIDHHDPWLKNSQFLSAEVPRLGRPDSLVELTGKSGALLNSPANRFFVDVSSLNPQHNIPYGLLAQIIKAGNSLDASMYGASAANPKFADHLLVITQHHVQSDE